MWTRQLNIIVYFNKIDQYFVVFIILYLVHEFIFEFLKYNLYIILLKSLKPEQNIRKKFH